MIVTPSQLKVAEFGRMFKDWRGKRSQAWVAQQLGISTPFYTRIEKGQANTSYSVASRLTKMTGTDLQAYWEVMTKAKLERAAARKQTRNNLLRKLDLSDDPSNLETLANSLSLILVNLPGKKITQLRSSDEHIDQEMGELHEKGYSLVVIALVAGPKSEENEVLYVFAKDSMDDVSPLTNQ